MKVINYTLVSDGSSDKVLINIITWLFHNLSPTIPVNGEWADLRRLINPPKNLSDRVIRAIDYYPCDILFIHRDAENQSIEARHREIEQAISSISNDIKVPPKILVVPVRMTEAWLIINEEAIRRASDNPNGTIELTVPKIDAIENISNPKGLLHQLLIDASEKHGRMLKQFKARVNKAVHRVADNINDFSVLRELSAFNRFEEDVKNLLNELYSC